VNVLFSSALWPRCVWHMDDPPSTPCLPRPPNFSTLDLTGSLHRRIRLGVRGKARNKSVAGAHLVVARQDLERGVDAAQVVLAQLGANVLHDEVNGHHVVAARPRNYDVRNLWQYGTRSSFCSSLV